MAINGKQYDHEDCNIILPCGLAFGTTEVSYNDGQDIDPRYGRKAIPRGWGRKNYEAAGSKVMDRDQFEVFKTALALNGDGSVYDHEPYNMVISYANKYQPLIVDKLKDIKITKVDTSYKQGESNDNQVKIDFKILSPIIWNGVPAKKG